MHQSMKKGESAIGRKKTGPKRSGKPLPPDALGSRVELARLKNGFTQKELGERVGGLSHAAISKIESGSTKDPGKATLVTLATVLQDDFGIPELKPYAHGEVFNGVPEVVIRGYLSAGVPIRLRREKHVIEVPSRWLISGRTIFGLQVDGYSMVDYGMEDGDYLILYENQKPENGQFVLTQYRDFQYSLARWQRKGDEVTLTPGTCEARDKILHLSLIEDEVVCVGGNVGMMRIF